MSSLSLTQRTPAPMRFKAFSVVILFSLILATLPIPFISVVPSGEAAPLFANTTSSVFINEFHYDDAGTDANEFIEVAAPAGTNMANYAIVLYNGNGGAVYDTDALSGTTTNQSGGYGFVSITYPQDGIQNGSPDGIALVNTATNTLVQFLCYEGTFTGVGGAAHGVPCTNISVTESGSGAEGASLQLQGTGSTYGDFTWAVRNTLNGNTKGAVNTAQTFIGGGNTAPTINAPANPAATVTQDASPFPVSLSGNDDGGIYSWSATAGSGVSSVSVTGGQGTANVTYTVSLVPGFNGTATFTASLSDTVNPAVSQVVNIQVDPPLVVNNPPTITPPANPAATVTQNSEPFPINLSGSDDGGVFNWTATAGAGVSTVSVTSGQGTSNATYTVTLQSGFTGTATFTASLSDNVNAPPVEQVVNIAVTPPPALDHIVISQIYGGGGNSGATYRNDYVELFNPTTGPVDLGGWTIQYASATGTSWQVQPLGGVIQPGEYYLISLASGGAVGAFLPAANIEGSINMSGTTGKVALSSAGDPLSGCPVGDPTLVDLVGYGTATCSEGATNAPAPSNTRALFRKNDGFTDTNVNGSDFITGTPAPRRTAAITEIGPYVLSVDPRNNATTAPRDASITVTFTEPVNVSGNWYNINCVTTGLHNDATIGGGGSSWIITPNTNFLAGEQCTVTIAKDLVSDADLDDSAPGSDTLKADYSWTFTVATGTAPAYGPDVHLTMGNPTGATADINEPTNYLMVKPEFALSYNRDLGTPNWVSWHLADEWIGTLQRNDTFRPDPAVPSDWYRVLHIDYFGSGFDRGHMVPNADRDPETSIPINQATFLMSNMIPQSPDNNQGPWADQENYLRTLLPANELYIIAGGAGTGGTGSNGFATTIADGHVTVPSVTWKVALVLPKGENDLSRVDCSTRTIAVIMPNVQGIRNNDWTTYLTTVDAVEALTGYDFFSNLPEPIQRCVEAGINGNNPPLDTDADTVPDSTDNCPFSANTDQANFDNDSTGDACDTDDDNDGATDEAETTAGSDPFNANSTPEICDGVDNDLNDGIDEGFTNTDSDNQADCVDTDDDNDGVSDAAENAAGSDPLNSNSTPEVCDGVDNDLNEGTDEGFTNTDGDGQADCVDNDDDNDGVSDTAEIAAGSDPLNANSKPEICDGVDNDLNDGIDEGFADSDHDGQADCVDNDDDNDSVADATDNCPLNANSDQADFDLDGIGDVCDSQTGPPVNMDQCKNSGWMRFDTPRTFKNQGDCIQFVNTGK